METAVPVEERIGGWRMAQQFRETCNVDLVHVQACVRGIVEGSSRFPVRAKVPKFYPTQRLQKLHLTPKHVQIDAARAKHSVLQAIAFMSWWTAVVSDWESELFEGMTERISGFVTTIKKGKRGVICNLEKDWPVINIPLHVQNNIPFFYLWDFEARSDSRFSRLNPALNMTYWGIRKGTPPRIPTDLEEEDLNKMPAMPSSLTTSSKKFFYTRSHTTLRYLNHTPSSSSTSKGGNAGPSNIQTTF